MGTGKYKGQKGKRRERRLHFYLTRANEACLRNDVVWGRSLIGLHRVICDVEVGIIQSEVGTIVKGVEGIV